MEKETLKILQFLDRRVDNRETAIQVIIYLLAMYKIGYGDIKDNISEELEYLFNIWR